MFWDFRADEWLREIETYEPDETDEPPFPPPLVRGSNRYFYFGQYPVICARIVNTEQIELKENLQVISRPIAGFPNDTRIMKGDVVTRIKEILLFLERQGIPWSKEFNVIVTNNFVIECYVCEDGMIYIITDCNDVNILNNI
jgi:hypothetical protein